MDDEIFSARRVLGLKPLLLREGRLLLREDDEEHTGLAVLQERRGRWLPVGGCSTPGSFLGRRLGR
ncbi:hypothetical protein [Hyalangium sp.]|uniref:hypothetical protein n=1 Tax=Hyalangium sp. TaxID=2028555 RepID=UPI002D420E90|nr:hypothetical protein [Hyalangium sp.]HYI02399.1 hypothetical protein [Hyalangium sp.]